MIVTGDKWLRLEKEPGSGCGWKGEVDVHDSLCVPEDDDRDDERGHEQQVETEEQGVHHVAELHPQAHQLQLLGLVFLLGHC